MSATLVLVIVIALAFDFTNGFHDTANAVATSISTRAMSPHFAVISAAILNFAGAVASIKVAATIASGIVDQDAVTLKIIMAGLIGAITWNLLTWFFGLPSSSSHALIGGVGGAVLAASGASAINWEGLKDKVLIPSLLAPVLGVLGAGLVVSACTWLVARPRPGLVNRLFRRLQLVSGGFVAFTHGTNDVPGIDDPHDVRLGARRRRDAGGLGGAVGRRRQHPRRVDPHDPLRRAHGGGDGDLDPLARGIRHHLHRRCEHLHVLLPREEASDESCPLGTGRGELALSRPPAAEELAGAGKV